MEDWKAKYKQKVVSPDQAVKIVKSGDKVGFGFPRQPILLTRALVARAGELKDVDIITENPRIDDGWLETDNQGAFKVTLTYFIGPVMRKWTDLKLADYIPITFSTEPRVTRDHVQEGNGLDVYLGVVTPPDEHGFCNFGDNLWNKRTNAMASSHVILEVDDSMIRTYGNGFIHVSEVDYFVENSPKPFSEDEFNKVTADANPKRLALLKEIFDHFTPFQRSEHFSYLLNADDSTLESYSRIFGLGELDHRAKTIASYVEPLIHDGDTIQVGISGASSLLPKLGIFDNKIDLGYHGEMAARGICNLIKAGVITGKYKTINKGKAIFTSLEGTGPEELEFANLNPLIELHDAEYVININTISAHKNMVSLNNAISIDLMGQINCESTFNGRMINGTGGVPESHIGAVLSPGGRAITLLYSTALSGASSCIVPQFEPGATVTIPRYFADYIVSEYGVARLMGKSGRQRANELINIAHPKFRNELEEEAKKLFG
jgi:4-hydroxybutyrate CoA-transferase